MWDILSMAENSETEQVPHPNKMWKFCHLKVQSPVFNHLYERMKTYREIQKRQNAGKSTPIFFSFFHQPQDPFFFLQSLCKQMEAVSQTIKERVILFAFQP